MSPDKVNFSGNVHGGHLLHFLDQVAYACAARYSGGHVVTLSVDNVLFKEPIHVGELVTCDAAINYVGKTSIEVGIRVTAQNLLTQKTRHTNTCYFTMVAVDENLHPREAPRLTAETAEQKLRQEEAKLRREIRMRLQKEHADRKAELRAKIK
ncbi:MAG: acyl-CoA thioesterase [Gammaproteobacteria bacterium]